MKTNKIMNATKVSQVIPASDIKIIVEALSLLEATLKALESEDQAINFKLHDILTLKVMLDKTELVVNLPLHIYNNFTAIHGVDYPIYF